MTELTLEGNKFLGAVEKGRSNSFPLDSISAFDRLWESVAVLNDVRNEGSNLRSRHDSHHPMNESDKRGRITHWASL